MTADVSTDPTDSVEDPSPGEAPGLRLSSPALLAAVGLYVAAGGHVIAALVHLDHGARYSVFFLAVAAAQVVVAGRVARASAGVRTVGAVLAATLGLVLLYVASRTITLPFGGAHVAHNDRPQEPDLLGTVVVIGELLTLATVPALLSETLRRRATTAMLVVGAGMWVAWATGLV